MADGATAFQRLNELTNKLMVDLDADILLYSGTIERRAASRLSHACRARAKRKNVCLFIMTPGGSADAAYRIARCLRRGYEKFAVYVGEDCKSAGTLLAAGADEIVMSDSGEFGPLDVQLYKPDELGEMSSGLTPMQALNTLGVQSFSLFEHHFLRIRAQSMFQITTRTAAELASNITIGLFAPIYAQIDPMRLGEINRAMRIAHEYGDRIGAKNLKEEALENLVAAYPSHEFVIDREEAATLFENIREPSPDEEELMDLAHPLMHLLEDEGIVVAYLDEILGGLPAGTRAEDEDEATEDEDDGPVNDTDRADHEEERPEDGEADGADDA